MISVVIPTLNAAETLPAALSALVAGAVSSLVREVVVADAGSTDQTLAIVEDTGARLVSTEAGTRLDEGCTAAKGPWLLILPADIRLAPEWEGAARDHMAHHAGEAGYFRFALDDHRAAARLAEAGMSLAATLGWPSAGQGLLLPKWLYEAVKEKAAPRDAQALLRSLGGRLRPLPARAFRVSSSGL